MLAGIGRQRVSMVQPSRVDRERLLGREGYEIRISPHRDTALAPQPENLSRPLRHPANDVSEAVSASMGLGPDDRQAELQGCDAAPGAGKIADIRQLEFRDARRMIGDDFVDDPGGQATPERVPVCARADRRAALEL